jgi:hypothetical protein
MSQSVLGDGGPCLTRPANSCDDEGVSRVCARLKWWALLDSNQRPSDYESPALTD